MPWPDGLVGRGDVVMTALRESHSVHGDVGASVDISFTTWWRADHVVVGVVGPWYFDWVVVCFELVFYEWHSRDLGPYRGERSELGGLPDFCSDLGTAVIVHSLCLVCTAVDVVGASGDYEALECHVVSVDCVV